MRDLHFAALFGGLIASSPFVSFLALVPAVHAQTTSSGTVWVTPHESYSSSVGVLGCKIDTNRVAYWPASVSCDDICVSLTYQDRSLHLLRIDQSQGAYDVSYDAWNYLITGKSAADDPTAGGATEMQFKTVDASNCKDLLRTNSDKGLNGARKLALSASNSMNYVASCLAQPDSWVANNYELYNIQDSLCTWGVDETCTLEDYPAQNQAQCPSGLGATDALTDDPVYNVKYPTGETVLASSGEVVDTPAGSERSSRLAMPVLLGGAAVALFVGI